MKKFEKAIKKMKNVELVMTFKSKKKAKSIWKYIESERLNALKSESESDRKVAKESKVVLKGKAVIIKGRRKLAKSFAEDILN